MEQKNQVISQYKFYLNNELYNYWCAKEYKSNRIFLKRYKTYKFEIQKVNETVFLGKFMIVPNIDYYYEQIKDKKQYSYFEFEDKKMLFIYEEVVGKFLYYSGVSFRVQFKNSFDEVDIETNFIFSEGNILYEWKDDDYFSFGCSMEYEQNKIQYTKQYKKELKQRLFPEKYSDEVDKKTIDDLLDFRDDELAFLMQVYKNEDVIFTKKTWESFVHNIERDHYSYGIKNKIDMMGNKNLMKLKQKGGKYFKHHPNEECFNSEVNKNSKLNYL